MKKAFLLTIVAVIMLTGCQAVDVNAPAPAFDPGVDTEAWAAIPAGEFLEGQFNKTVDLDYDYEMMVTNVTNDQYAKFLNEALADGTVTLGEKAVTGYYPGDVFNEGRHEEEIKAGDYLLIPLNEEVLRLDLNGETFSAKEPWGNHPMTMVSWFGAKAYCEYYDWRLPTELEWEKAARGTDGRPYPWGETLARNNANFLTTRDPFENMSSFGSRTTPVGFYNGGNYAGYQTLDSPSPYGLYDMAGNVWQWTGDVYVQQHYRYMRGGSKDVYENNLRSWVRNNATPTYTSPGAGFRCAR